PGIGADLAGQRRAQVIPLPGLPGDLAEHPKRIRDRRGVHFEALVRITVTVLCSISKDVHAQFVSDPSAESTTDRTAECSTDEPQPRADDVAPHRALARPVGRLLLVSCRPVAERALHGKPALL